MNGLCYIAGLLTIPAICVAVELANCAYCASRDTMKFARLPMEPGYSEWRKLWRIPLLWFEMLWKQITRPFSGLEISPD